MKTTEQIFDWLVRNCHYYDRWKDNRVQEFMEDLKHYPDEFTLEVNLTYVVPFHVEVSLFEQFIGSKLNYKRHLKPLMDQGLVIFHPDYSISQFDDLGSSRYDIAGTVRDYVTGSDYICFWLGNKNPNDNLRKTNA